MEQPLVSVCIQTYQHAGFIRQTIDNALMQVTDFPFEILLGEDESTDGTREICMEYAEKYPDVIRLFLNERKNVIHIDGNPTGRWNFMNNLKHARGKYIAMLPGDDYWISENKLQKQVEILEDNSDYSMCFHDVYLLEEDGSKRKFPDIHGKNIFTLTDLFTHWFIPTCSMVFRNTVELPEWYTDVASGDIALQFLIAEQGDFLYIPEPFGIYRRHASGLSMKHVYYRKAMAMSRLYHYVDLHFDKKHRGLIEKAIESEIETHVVNPRVKEVEKKYSWLRSPLARAILVRLRRMAGDKTLQ